MIAPQEHIGGRIRRLRQSLGWTQKELADRSGVSLRFLVQIEQGKANLSLERMLELSQALSVSMTSLVYGMGGDEIDLFAERFAALPPRGRQEVIKLLSPVNKLALIGLRGAGKTTLGEALAQQLSWPFLALDREVERRSGLKLAEIFEHYGAPYYASLCIDALQALLSNPSPCILEIGGSLVLDPVAYALLLNTTQVVWLKASPESHLSRVRSQGDLRPMEGRPDALEELRTILNARTPLYARAHHTLDTEAGLSQVLKALSAIARQIKAV